MKRLLYILLFLLGQQATALAQPEHRIERIHAIKVGFFTERLQLSSKEAEDFWPVYNAYEDELRAIRNTYRDKYRKTKGAELSPMAAQKFIDDDIAYREQALGLRKKYKDSLLKVISAQQLAELYKAEADFKEMLIKRLERRGGPPGRMRR